MQGEGVHVEFSFTGISRDMFRSILEWMWEFVEPAFPIITGAWGLQQTLYFSAAIAGLALVARVIRYLNEGGTSDERIPAGLAVNTVGGIAAHTPEPAQKAMLSASTARGTTTPTNTSEVSNEVSKMAAVVLVFTRRSLGFISQMGMTYLVLSLLVCVFFGTGDLKLLDVLFGIGG